MNDVFVKDSEGKSIVVGDVVKIEYNFRTNMGEGIVTKIQDGLIYVDSVPVFRVGEDGKPDGGKIHKI